MITVYHLENSRSQRILWLLEELGVPYEVERFARDPTTQRAPEALRAVSPLGKAPAIRDGDLVLVESGAIVEHLLARHGSGRLAPPPDAPERPRYLQWLHFAEGSAMPPLVLELLLGLAIGSGGEPSPLVAGIRSEIQRMLAHLDEELAQRSFFAGSEFTAADLMMAFPIELADARGHLGPHANLRAFLERVRSRPAFERARRAGA